jgi:hypothetical protein
MNELVRTLQSRITDLERTCARYENARLVLCIEIDHLRRKLGFHNTHPDADKCGCATPPNPGAAESDRSASQ